ncbi:hypothetical protein [Actinomadura napierensis]|uniref:Transmembrane protein n=1 Tax=Actinomadura napierensis TaxID=267854 RepID=A0ABP5LM20_9ACTN
MTTPNQPPDPRIAWGRPPGTPAPQNAPSPAAPPRPSVPPRPAAPFRPAAPPRPVPPRPAFPPRPTVPPAAATAAKPPPAGATALVEDALKSWRQVARKEPLIVIAIVAAAVGVANVPGMYQAASNWRARISGDLDKPANQTMRGLQTDSGKDWIADDQEAFARAVDDFVRQLETCRKYAEACGGAVESVAKAYTSYWTALGDMAVAILPAFLTLWALQRVPYPPTSIGARIAATALALGVIAAVGNLVYGLTQFLSAAKNIMSTLLAGGAVLQLRNLKPSGASAIAFKDAKIDWSPPSTYKEPRRTSPSPYGG